jgi:hypothetical protein
MLVENLNIVKGGKCSRYGWFVACHVEAAAPRLLLWWYHLHLVESGL